MSENVNYPQNMILFPAQSDLQIQYISALKQKHKKNISVFRVTGWEINCFKFLLYVVSYSFFTEKQPSSFVKPEKKSLESLEKDPLQKVTNYSKAHNSSYGLLHKNCYPNLFPTMPNYKTRIYTKVLTY